MPLALLLSPDDQAVNAVKAVLEEMLVTCERPLDGVSAARKLSSQEFDLVLVDCENLPAAKLIFDVCRRGKGGKTPVPIAIVDGRAGLPTAFRLGAELILTKPVAKDQARNTVRTAINRVKRDEPANGAPPAELNATHQSAETEANTASPETEALLTRYETSPEVPNQVAAETNAMAAAASSSGDPAALGMAMTTSAAVEAEIEMKMSAAAPAVADHAIASAEKAANVSDAPRPTANFAPSDDPVLAELERSESEPNKKPNETEQPPILSAYREGEQKKSRGPLVAVVVLVLIASGVYAAWMTQPAFRTFAQPLVEHVLGLVGMTHPAPTIPSSTVAAKPAEPTTGANAPATVPAPAAQTGANSASGSDSSAEPASVGPTSAGSASVGLSSVPPASVAPAQPSPASSTASAAPAGAAPGAPPATKADVTKAATAQSPAGQKSAEPVIGSTVPSASAAQPTDKTAVVLSSKGAEGRLVHSVPPTYPKTASGAEGTVVLKALIDESGKVTSAQAVEGNAVLTAAAIAAVKQWRYRPYLRDGKAVPFQTIVLIDFQKP